MISNMRRWLRWAHTNSLAAGLLLVFGLIGGLRPTTNSSQQSQMLEEVGSMPKIDIHAHITDLGHSGDKQFIGFLENQNFKWLDICVVGTEWG